MFSNIAYEALYEYIGLSLHQKFIEVIASQKVFLAVVLVIFGVMFFTTSLQFFSRYLPGALVQRRFVPLSRYVKIIFCLFLGISILRIGTTTDVKKFDGTSWKDNAYVRSKVKDNRSDFKVSLVFDLLSRSAEEVAALLSRIVDNIFKTSHSQLDAPNFFYKAVMMAGAASITDPSLKEAVHGYSSQCLDRLMPLVGNKEAIDHLDSMFGNDRTIDQKLATLTIDGTASTPYTCLNAKNEVRQKLMEYTRANSDFFKTMHSGLSANGMSDTSWLNMQASMSLVDHFMESREGFAGIEKGSVPQSGMARVIQHVSKALSWDGLISIISREGRGAALSAERAQEFSENLSRAPHVAGFIKMALFAIFPWLCFFVIAGRWKVLLYWYAIYASVLIWTPIWTLLYHVMLGISLSTETMAALGKLSDGFSLYSASLVSSKMNYMFAVYSWLQLLIGASFTGSLLWFLKPVLSDSETESAPEFIDEAKSAARNVGRAL